MNSNRFTAGIRPALLALLLGATGLLQATDVPPAHYPNYPSETPAKFTPTTASFDYERRDVMVPMRDGVKLHTVILIPKGAHHAGILFTRTPYDANALTRVSMSGQLEVALAGYDNVADIIVEDGYIRVVQDVRGKYGSEGDYVMNRPPHGPLNPTPVDDATDTYDSIDWLVKNIPETNGKVATLGISYDGFEPLMALIHPHPALKVSVPMNPMVDGWMGDDWFHNGAFRQQNLAYIYEQTASRDNSIKWWTNFHDEYDLFMHYGSAGALADAYGMRQLGFWNKLLAHPAYDSFWSDQAVDKLLAKEPLTVPVMLVHSLWDQEDSYGAQAVYRAIKPKDTSGNMVKLVMGPWNHGQEIGEGSSLGALRFGSDTAKYFREKILRPYLAQYLKDGAPKADIAAVTAYQTGSNQWQRLDRWPLACSEGCPTKSRALYLEADNKLGFNAPASGSGYDEYVSDPAHPVPFRARPIQPIGYGTFTWPQWLVDDQREASGRTDVVSYVSDVLTAPLTISGVPEMHLVASTSGTDSDWVVKLIDVYPDQVAYQPEMGGYQLAIGMDIFRGRYREGFTAAKPIAANQALPYHFALPSANHVFLPGHRIMVQVQSSWFPLYDRNPQTFVPNILLAKPADYVKATQRIYHAANEASFIALPVAGG
ncbi:CocE/NonD family hydrolase [Rhodanobacter sp. AS-Z3]|uniref:CocE/NonD family hydrolase n=1 Tax=Rhodanobacter sp. AS-Z3 TaxID=3031330 RepID=UPI0024786D3F|nr:CocE/NonD family hydrolase [Rhodanobacter sp. AS-Z3]WEN14795.1 CocE/NonD family hydrolase [Rhodanobacter sp. AS-Z3]